MCVNDARHLLALLGDERRVHLPPTMDMNTYIAHIAHVDGRHLVSACYSSFSTQLFGTGFQRGATTAAGA